MACLVEFSLTAPKFIDLLNSKGITINAKDGVFTNFSDFSLPSGMSACIYDEFAWGKTLYGPQEMGLPRYISDLDADGSVSVWLFKHLTGYDEDEDYEYEEEFEEGIDTSEFCKEFEAILISWYNKENMWEQIAALDDDIENADILIYSGEDGEFNFTHIEITNGIKTTRRGSNYDQECESWYWKDLNELKKLIIEDIEGTTHIRKDGKWEEK